MNRRSVNSRSNDHVVKSWKQRRRVYDNKKWRTTTGTRSKSVPVYCMDASVCIG